MIAIGLPHASQQQWIDKLPRPLRAWSARDVWPANYDDIATAMNHTSVVIVGTSMCSCDLFNPAAENDMEAKLRKEGWSKGKIERALANRNRANQARGLHPELRRWLAEVAADTGEVYVLVHVDGGELVYNKRIDVATAELREQTCVIQAEQLTRIVSLDERTKSRGTQVAPPQSNADIFICRQFGRTNGATILSDGRSLAIPGRSCSQLR